MILINITLKNENIPEKQITRIKKHFILNKICIFEKVEQLANAMKQ